MHDSVSYSVNLRIKLVALALAFCTACALGQYPADKPLGATAQSTPSYLKNAGIDQNLNHALPLTDHFRNENNNDVTLGSYFGHDQPSWPSCTSTAECSVRKSSTAWHHP